MSLATLYTSTRNQFNDFWNELPVTTQVKLRTYYAACEGAFFTAFLESIIEGLTVGFHWALVRHAVSVGVLAALVAYRNVKAQLPREQWTPEQKAAQTGQQAGQQTAPSSTPVSK